MYCLCRENKGTYQLGGHICKKTVFSGRGSYGVFLYFSRFLIAMDSIDESLMKLLRGEVVPITEVDASYYKQQNTGSEKLKFDTDIILFFMITHLYAIYSGF